MKKAWEKKEISDAKSFQGKRVPGSGNQRYKKGDVKTTLFLIEDKSTDKKSFRITKTIWEKIATSALLSQRIPILSVKFSKDTEIVILSKYDFLNLI